MASEMHISFPGGKKVYADFKGMEIPTDQPIKEGGDGSAPQPFMLFLTSMVTCAGIYVLSFCDKRNISTEGIRIVQKHEYNAKGKLEKVTIEIVVPPEFPEKHINTLTRVADLCAVKRTILDSPEFETRTVVATS